MVLELCLLLTVLTCSRRHILHLFFHLIKVIMWSRTVYSSKIGSISAQFFLCTIYYTMEANMHGCLCACLSTFKHAREYIPIIQSVKKMLLLIVVLLSLLRVEHWLLTYLGTKVLLEYRLLILQNKFSYLEYKLLILDNTNSISFRLQFPNTQ